MKNNISITVSQVSCDKIAGIAKYIPSADASIFGFKYKETEETKISRDYGAFGITGYYKKGAGLNLNIEISDDLIDLGVNAIYTFVPAICGAVCSLAGHVGRLKKLLKINDDHKPARVKYGDKVKVIYTIGRRNTTSKVITVGLAEMGESIDHMLTGMRLGQVYSTDIVVMDTEMPVSIMVDKIIERSEIDSSDESLDNYKIYGGMGLPNDYDHSMGAVDIAAMPNACDNTGYKANPHGGNSAVRFSCDEDTCDDGFTNDKNDDSIGDDNHIANAVRSLRDDACTSGMTAEEFFGDTDLNAKELDAKSWDEF